MNLLLKNLIWYNGQERISGDVRLAKGIILETGKNLKPTRSEQVIEFKSHFLYPGLINAHDHLEMNLYPRLGSPPYNNYLEWSGDIYKPHESPIREIEQVDIKDRLLWGGLKNLISGVTTVVHHNPWHTVFGKSEFPVTVLKQMAWAHSLALDKNIERAFPKRDSIPFVIHAGEGTDSMALSEIPRLDALGMLRKNTVLIHAVALEDTSIDKIITRQAAVVWCPVSNFFLFGKTAPIEKLKDKIKIAIGTDSTLTGAPTLLDEMRTSAQTIGVTPIEIFRMVTHLPARIFKLPEPEISHHNTGDLFVTPIRHENYFDNLMVTRPADIALVVVKGKVNLLDSEIEGKWNSLKNSFTIDGRLKRTHIDIASLKKRINQKVGSEILEKNPLWKLIEI